MYLITGATGNTGSGVAERLLEAGRKVRVVVRSAEKAAGLARRGAEVVVGDLNDERTLAPAFAGVEGAYIISPPDARAADFLQERKQLLASYVAAAKQAGVPHLVFLSSLGAQHAQGTGIIRSAYNGEQLLRESGIAVTAVRAGYFVANWASVLPAAREQGVLPSFIAAGQRIPMLDTADIARVAAAALLEGPRGPGVRVIELAGPEDASPNDVAAVLGRLLKRSVQVSEAPPAAASPAFESFGFSPNVAGLYAELYAGVAAGTVVWQGDGAEFVRGSIPLEASLRALLG